MAYHKTIKNKKNKERVVDDDGYMRRVAALCVTKINNEYEVLLITSKKSHEEWIIPGGGIDVNETAEEAVTREAVEEAGVICKIERKLGIVERSEKKERTEVFQLTVESVLETWEEFKENKRLRKWFSLPDAYEKIDAYKPEQRKYLDLL